MKKLVCFVFFSIFIFKSDAAYDRCQRILESPMRDNISDLCVNQLYAVCKNPDASDKMWDATSRYPFTGMLYSSNQEMGNFDECLTIDFKYNKSRILGKHCTYGIVVLNPFLNGSIQDYDPTVKETITVELAEQMQQAMREEYLKAETEDTKPPFISALSMCIPDACSAEDITWYLRHKSIIMNILLNKDITGYNVSLVTLSDDRCSTKETGTELGSSDIGAISFFGVIATLMIISTIYDVILNRSGQKPKHPLLLAFSIYTNGKKLLQISTGNRDQIEVFNGMRLISMAWVVAGHTWGGWRMSTLINAIEFKKVMQPISIQYIASAPVSVDTFFLISGFLLAYGYLKQKPKSVVEQLKQVPHMYLHRYIRLTPAAAVLFLVAVSIFSHLGSGPIWVTGTQKLVGGCTRNWHAYFFYYQNYYNFDDDICITPTWYLSADMQMFIISPLFLIPMSLCFKNKFKYIVWGMSSAAIVSIGITLAIRFGLRQKYTDDYDTHSRLCIYFLGMTFGAYMRKYKENGFVFSRKTNLIIWCVVFLYLILFNWPYHIVLTRKDDTLEYLFYALYRPFYGLCLCWITYACHFGYGGIVNWILTRPIYQIGVKLSYSIYLLHGLVVAYIVLIQRTPFYFNHYMVFYTWCGNIIVTTVLSAVWVLAFESPLVVLEKFVFGRGPRQPTQTAPQKTAGTIA